MQEEELKEEGQAEEGIDEQEEAGDECGEEEALESGSCVEIFFQAKQLYDLSS